MGCCYPAADVLVPMFSVDNNQNASDALAWPPGARSGMLCGTALGNTLITLFGNLPEGFKTASLAKVASAGPGAT